MAEQPVRYASRIAIGAGGAIAVLVVGMAAASGQGHGDNPPVVRQLDASEVSQRYYRVADLFGESDEEKEARLQKEQSQDAAIAALQQHVQDLENSLRRVTGELEQQDHKIGELNARIDRMQKDFDYKLCTLAAQQLGASSDQGDQNSLACGGQGAPASAAAAPNGPSYPPAAQSAQEPIHLAPPPGVLGTLPANNAGAPRAAAVSSPNRSKFDAAMNLLAKAQYDEARSAFRSFADSYPDDPLTPQAVYWIGDIAYVQKDYGNAAHAFAEEIKRFPDNPRGPDSMLKLGQSLIAMGQKKEGCTALAALSTKYPDASKAVIGHAADARKAAACK